MEQDHAIAATATRLTVAEAGERLIDQLEAMGRKKSTLEGYRSALNVHLATFFGAKSIERITREDVEGFIAARTRAKAAPKSIQNYVGVLHGIFDLAIRRGWAQTNPVKLAERPRKTEGREVRFLTMAEMEALLRAVPDDDLGRVERVLYLAAATDGDAPGRADRVEVARRRLAGPPHPRAAQLRAR